MPESILIYNPAAGQWWRRPAAEKVRDRLAARGCPCRLLVTRGQDDATRLVRENLRADTEVVWACGGDGTLGQVAAALVDSGVPIGVVPTGSVNVVARECGIPLKPWPSIDALTAAPGRRSLRVWEVGGRAVLLGMGVGFEARTIGHVGPRIKDWLGMPAIAGRGVREWARYESPPLVVSGEDARGELFEHRCTQVLVSNTRHFAGRQVVLPGADPEDRHLDLLLFEGHSRLRLAAFWVGVQLPVALQLRVPGVRRLRARRLEVRSGDGEPVEVHVNGDMVERTPVTVRPWGEVQLLVPAASRPQEEGRRAA